MLRSIEGLGLWILPDQESEKDLLKIINRCSALLNSETFLPHITISRVPDLPVQELKERILRITESHSRFKMEPDGIECRSEPYQKICLRCVPNHPYKNLTETIDRSFGGSFSKKTDPHISMLYSDSPCSRLTALLEELDRLKITRLPVNCYRLGLVRFSGTPSDWKLLMTADLNSLI